MTTSVSLSSGTSPGELCVLIYPDRTSLPVSVLGLLLLKDPGVTWWDRSHIRGEVRELAMFVNGSFEVSEEPALNNLPVWRCEGESCHNQSYLELDLAVGELPVHIVGDTFLQCDDLAPPQHAQVLPSLTVAAAL